MTDTEFEAALDSLRANADTFIESGDYSVLEHNKAVWDALKEAHRDDEAAQILSQEALAMTQWPDAQTN